MAQAVVLDGELVSAEQAKVSVFDRGFLYGDSVFETIRTYGGRPYQLDAHLQRLASSAAQVFIELPVSLDVFEHEVRLAVSSAGNAESYIRVMVTRGRGALGLDPAQATRSLRVIVVTDLQVLPEEAYEKGVSVVTYRTQRLADATPAAGAKIGNYLVAVLAMKQAREAGAAEALIVDHDEHVIEGSTSNVFFVRHGNVITPPEAAGILPGITRKKVLELASRSGLRVDFDTLTTSELSNLDELFISSSIRELLPVVKVDRERIGNGRPGPITTKLLSAFRSDARRGQ